MGTKSCTKILILSKKKSCEYFVTVSMGENLVDSEILLKTKIWTHLNFLIGQKIWVETLIGCVGTKALHSIERVPQCSHIGSTV